MQQAEQSETGGKRQEILEAAGQTLVREGLQRTSISAMCRAAGISPGHLYHYFDSKEAILQALAEGYLASTRENFSKGVGSTSEITCIVAEIEQVISDDNPSSHALLFELTAEATRSEKLAAIIRRSTAEKRSLLTTLILQGQAGGRIDPGLDPDSTALAIIALIDASKLMALRDPEIDLTKSIPAVSTMVMRLLAWPRL